MWIRSLRGRSSCPGWCSRKPDGNRDDHKPLEAMTAALQGKVLADKSYLSQSLLERLWQRGLHLVTGIRRTMKNHLWSTPATDPPAMSAMSSSNSLMSGGNHPGTTQGQHWQNPHPHGYHPMPLLTLSTTRVPEQLSRLSPVACFLTNRLLLRSVTLQMFKGLSPKSYEKKHFLKT
ncbi:MAG: hypothetical protein F4162_07880 [Synechococcus sp. SB0676_bin_10]|uniref:Transposase DDE domain-containing protein n=1 Tax=Synechococcus sp. SB0676_bin_10 TaxID=2604869 RepID=A0A6B1FAS3_9SYNE|nr:hypothetical protein [Cyanobacteria bacterium MAG IRC3_bin_20]MDE0646775.1 hypothetical protein [Cyanobacteria bacterium MAG IRC4_bin_6]MYG38866.1 hypothetical protein [Synechococcus sp. SB0676_bin_10]